MGFSLKRCKLQRIRTETWEKAVAPAIEHTILPKTAAFHYCGFYFYPTSDL